MKKFILLVLVLVCLVSVLIWAGPEGQGPVIETTKIKNTPSNVMSVDVDHMDTAPAHKEVVIIAKSQDSIVWYSTTSGFRIKKLEDMTSGHAAGYPFFRALEHMRSTKSGDRWVLHTGPAIPSLPYEPEGGELYKPTFVRINQQGQDTGPDIDPHIAIKP